MSLTAERVRANGHRNDPVPGRRFAITSRPSRTLIWLASAAGLLGVVSAATGLLSRGTGGTVTATTFLGERVELYGRGLYGSDTVFVAANNFATDLVLLVLGAPLLGISLWLAARGSLRARLVLLGTLGFFVYYGATYALGGVAYNELFLLYVALFSVSSFSFIKAFTSFDKASVAGCFTERPPRRLAGIFMIVSSVATAAIWLMEPVGGLISGATPSTLETHTTLFTHAFDLAIIVPTAFLAGLMILRREVFGYVVASSLLILEALLLPIISTATLIQVDLGIEFTPAEIVGPIAGFGVLAGSALWVTSAILRRAVPPPRL